MKPLSLSQILNFWADLLNGQLKSNTVTFNNENGRGEISGFNCNDHLIVARLNLNLKQQKIVQREALDNKDYVTFFLGDPIDVKFLNKDVDQQFKFDSLGIFTIRTNQALEWKFKASENMKLLMIRIRRDYLYQYITMSPVLMNLFSMDKSFYHFEAFVPKLKQVFNEFYEVDKEDIFADKHIALLSDYFMTLFFKRMIDKEGMKKDNHFDLNTEPIYKAKQILENTTHKPISMDHLSEECGLSESRLRVLFKTVFGLTIHQYHQEIRLSKAQDLLLQGDKTLSMIAMDLGYSSGSHFSMVFKKQFNITPKEFKNQRLIRA